MTFRKMLAVSSIALLSSCASSQQKSVFIPKKMPQKTLKHSSSPILVDEWEHGTCTFRDNKITYSYLDRVKKIEIEENTEGAFDMRCSDSYSVVLTPKKAVTVVGPVPTYNGREMWGMLFGVPYPYNALAFGVEEPVSEGVKSFSLEGAVIVIKTKQGKDWYLDLKSPEKWNIIIHDDS